MDVRQLRYFVRIAELGGVSKAAGELRIAQSALSYQIRQLEEDLQVTLFHRHRGGVSLTEAGQVVLERANAVLRELNELRADAIAHVRYPSGKIAFAAPPSVARALVPQVVERFRTMYPDVRLAVREATSELFPDWVLQAEVDLALLYDLGPAPQLETVPLLPDRLYLVGSGRLERPAPGYSLAELCALPLVLTSMAYGWRRRFEKALAERDAHPFIRAEVDSLSVMKELVRRGFAYSIVPRSVVHLELQQGELWAMALPELVIPSTLVLVRPAHRSLSLAGQELQRLITEEVGALVAAGWGHREG